VKTVIFLSIVTASISFTVTETQIFKPFREWMKKKSPFLGKLFSCGYCLGHWVSFALVGIFRPPIIKIWWPLDYFLIALAVAWLSGMQWVLMCWFMERAGK